MLNTRLSEESVRARRAKKDVYRFQFPMAKYVIADSEWMNKAVCGLSLGEGSKGISCVVEGLELRSLFYI